MFNAKRLKFVKTLPDGSKGYYYKDTTVTNGELKMGDVTFRIASIGSETC